MDRVVLCGMHSQLVYKERERHHNMFSLLNFFISTTDYTGCCNLKSERTLYFVYKWVRHSQKQKIRGKPMRTRSRVSSLLLEVTIT
jgi:hypothetical protein